MVNLLTAEQEMMALIESPGGIFMIFTGEFLLFQSLGEVVLLRVGLGWYPGPSLVVTCCLFGCWSGCAWGFLARCMQLALSPFTCVGELSWWLSFLISHVLWYYGFCLFVSVVFCFMVGWQ